MRATLLARFSILFTLLTTAALAQSGGGYDLTWSAVTGGGGASAGNDGAGHTYILESAVAPPAEEAASDGYRLQGGFLAGAAQVTLVLLYINGDNNLAPYIHKLVQNVHRGATNPDIVVHMVLDWPGKDNSRRYVVDKKGETECNFQIDFTCGTRYVLDHNVTKFAEDLGDPANLTRFITESLALHPQADRVVLSLVGHGGGWSPNLLAGQPTGHGGKPADALGGLLWDDYTGVTDDEGNLVGNSLSTLDLRQALDDAYEITGRKIDLLYLDACLMGMWEVAHELTDRVDFLLVSQSWSWTAFPYHEHLTAVRNSQSIRAIGRQWTAHEAARMARDRFPYTYSLIDLARLPPLTVAIDNLAQELLPVVTTPTGKEGVRAAFEAGGCFDSNGDRLINLSDPGLGDGIDNYCDLHTLAGAIKARFAGQNSIVAASEAVQAALANAVDEEANRYGCGAPGVSSTIPWCWEELGGLSIYAPFGADDWKRNFYGQLQVDQKTAWGNLIRAYWNNVAAPAAPTCPPEQCPLPGGPLPVNETLFLPLVTR
jgi:hypothetical protein